MVQSWVSRTLACFLSLVLLSSGLNLTAPAQAHAEPVPAANNPVIAATSNPFASSEGNLHALRSLASMMGPVPAGFIDASKPPVFFSGTIPCTVYDSLDPSEKHPSTLASGIIEPTQVPTWPGYSYAHAWLVDPKDNTRRLSLRAVQYREDDTDHPLPGHEPYVIVTTANAQNKDFELRVPLSQAEQYIHLEYIKIGEVIKLSYAPASDDVRGFGPTKIYRDKDGIARAVFYALTPRNSYPQVSIDDTPGLTWSKVEDVSEPNQTIYRYELTVNNDFEADIISIKIHKNPRVNLSVTWSNKEPVQRPADCFRFSQKNRDNDNPATIRPYSEQGTQTINFGDEVTFNVYHGRATVNTVPWQVLLSALVVNGVPFGAPQGFSRYGMLSYDLDTYQWNGVWLSGKSNWNIRPPWYWTEGTSFWEQLRGCPYYVQSFTPKMNWEFKAAGYTPLYNDEPGGYLTWWKTQIARKVIGQKTQTTVQHGPLAGMNVEIQILDAIPLGFGRSLGNYPNGDPTQNMNPDSLWGSWPNLYVGNGYQNSMQMAYRVKLSNIPESITVDSEWIATTTSMIGLYDSDGVENQQAHVGAIGKDSDTLEPFGEDPSRLTWLDFPKTPTEQYVSVNGLYGTWISWETGGAGFKVNGNPFIELRGNVKNGYHNPKAVSTTRIEKGLKPLPAVEDGGEYGYQVKVPVIAKGGDPLFSGGANGGVQYGGLGSVGVQASLMQIPVYYDLGSGATTKPELFPTLVSGTPKLYNVQDNPIVHIPTDLPSQDIDGMPAFALYWKLYYQDAQTNQLVDTTKEFLGGESFDIRDPEIVERLSTIAGKDLVKNFVLKAVYQDEESLQGNPLVYGVNYNLSNELTHKSTIVQGPNFFAVPGLYVLPKEAVYPPVFPTQKDYKLKQGWTPELTLLKAKSEAVITIPYSNLTEAQKFQMNNSIRVNPPVAYPYATELTRTELKKLLVSGDKIPETAHFSMPWGTPDNKLISWGPNNNVQPVNMRLTFSDGSYLDFQGQARFLPPVMTGLPEESWLPLAAVLVVLVGLGAATTAFMLRRRRRRMG